MVEGVLTRSSRWPFGETLERIEAGISNDGLTVFAKIDHRDGAVRQGLEMQPATVLVFGNPRVGTPAMLKEPLAALELPLRILVWEDGGEARVSYQDPAFLAGRFGIPEEIPAHAAAIVKTALE